MKWFVLALSLLALTLVTTGADKAAPAAVAVTPNNVTVPSGGTQEFTGSLTPAQKADDFFFWSCTSGTITSKVSVTAMFTAPSVDYDTDVTCYAHREGWSREIGSTSILVTPTPRTVALDWQAVANAVSYSVYRSVSSSGPFALVASALQTLEYSDATVADGQTYYYVVTATDALGDESAYSNAVTVVIP